MLRGEPYMGDDPELRADRIRCHTIVDEFNATPSDQRQRRREILRTLLAAVGDDATILPPVRFDYGYQTSIGAGSFVNFGAVILDVGRVTIGDDVLIGPNVQLLTPTHPLDPELRRTGVESARPITIEDNVWLGGGVIVCPGVTIARDTVVGAGSVVTQDLPPRALAVGNPCRVVRQL